MLPAPGRGVCLLFLCLTPVVPLRAAELTLPIYRLTINPSFLDSLDADPYSDLTYPAELEYDGDLYPCHVRYRGGTSRRYPKESWKVYFDAEGPRGESETNLNAEYADISLCRNCLGMALARYDGLPAPETRFISLFVNGAFCGVFLEVEQVDAHFLRRRDLGQGALFKGLNHGARFAPFLCWKDLAASYEPHVAPRGALDTMGARISFIQYADRASIAAGLSSVIDVSNMVRFFAVQYCIVNNDGVTKNFFIHQLDDGRYILIPWDMDSSFGNDWLGNYREEYAEWLSVSSFAFQAVFQRIISIPEYRRELHRMIEELTTSGFDHIDSLITMVYSQIRNDVYLDSTKRGSNAGFEEEASRLRDFMRRRRQALRNLDWFHRHEVVENAVTSDYISTANETISFRAHIPDEIYEAFVIIHDSMGSFELVWLHDDGGMGDSIRGDNIYTSVVALPNYTPPFYYCFHVKHSAEEGYPTPPAGCFFFPSYRLSLPSIRLDCDPPRVGDVRIGPFYSSPETGTFHFGLVNGTERPLNLSGCVVRIGLGSHRMLRLDEVEPVPSGDTLFVTSNVDYAAATHGARRVTGCMYFAPQPGDTVFLETSSGRFLASSVVKRIYNAAEWVGQIAVNEINYNSGEEFNSGDWVELFAIRGSHNLGGWSLKDSRDDHSFTIPDGIVLSDGEFLTIAGDIAAFRRCFPTREPVISGFEFGFSGEGEELRLFDDAGALVDWVAYSGEPPWPTAADGDGATLELIHPTAPNFGPLNWRSSVEPFPYGTPGGINSVTYDTMIPGPQVVVPLTPKIFAAYPNPSGGSIRILYTIPDEGAVRFIVYDLSGRRVVSLSMGSPAGIGTAIWSGMNACGRPVPSGVYLLRLEEPWVEELREVVVVR